ncbi:hypothetical protein GCM10027091_78470 [Streptomyces daliensis]
MDIRGDVFLRARGAEFLVLSGRPGRGRPAAWIGDENLHGLRRDFRRIRNAGGGQAPCYGDMAANRIALSVRRHTTQYAEFTLSIEPYLSAA